jgi:hypothetical protein
LEINEAIELLAGETQLAPGRAQTAFSASESNLAHSDRQFSDLCADALCHRPAMTRHRVEILRHSILPRFRPTELGRIVRLLGSEVLALSTAEIGVCLPRHANKDFACLGLESAHRHP